MFYQPLVTTVKYLRQFTSWKKRIYSVPSLRGSRTGGSVLASVDDCITSWCMAKTVLPARGSACVLTGSQKGTERDQDPAFETNTPPPNTKLLGETSQALWRSHTQVSKGLPLVSASLKVPPCQQHSEKHAPHTWALERLIISQAQQGSRENEIFHGRLVKIGAQSYGFRMPDCRMLKVCGIYCVVDKETIYLHGDIFMYRDS